MDNKVLLLCNEGFTNRTQSRLRNFGFVSLLLLFTQCGTARIKGC